MVGWVFGALTMVVFKGTAGPKLRQFDGELWPQEAESSKS